MQMWPSWSCPLTLHSRVLASWMVNSQSKERKKKSVFPPFVKMMTLFVLCASRRNAVSSSSKKWDSSTITYSWEVELKLLVILFLKAVSPWDQKWWKGECGGRARVAQSCWSCLANAAKACLISMSVGETFSLFQAAQRVKIVCWSQIVLSRCDAQQLLGQFYCLTLTHVWKA